MITKLCRWPNGTLSIVTADDQQDLFKQLMNDDVCTFEEVDSPHGLIIDIQRGFNIHFRLTDEGEFEFDGLREVAMPTLERLYPHFMAASKIGYKTKKAAIAAAKAAVAKER